MWKIFHDKIRVVYQKKLWYTVIEVTEMKEIYRQRALQLHKKGYNCAQAVLCAFSDKIDTQPEVLFKISEGFGLGMGSMNQTCGALSGAVMLAGLKNSAGNASGMTKGATYQLAKHISRQFEEKNGATVCKELKGIETGKMLRSCDGCIVDAVEILYDALFGEGEA